MAMGTELTVREYTPGVQHRDREHRKLIRFDFSGTAASNQFGVAKSANIIAVKALHDSGYGDVSDM